MGAARFPSVFITCAFPVDRNLGPLLAQSVEREHQCESRSVYDDDKAQKIRFEASPPRIHLHLRQSAVRTSLLLRTRLLPREITVIVFTVVRHVDSIQGRDQE